MLSELGCELGQGFLFARPLDVGDVREQIRARMPEPPVVRVCDVSSAATAATAQAPAARPSAA